MLILLYYIIKSADLASLILNYNRIGASGFHENSENRHQNIKSLRIAVFRGAFILLLRADF
ncbi:MAG: hypothetical protein D3903_09350 [Candidatus Electrothrix sp. GM3_4]|nr:hypothetical protein [Candidatus Electrothrix sp. GM3_4]